MKAIVPVLICAAFCLNGCISGPSYLSRTVDDSMNKSYAESPIATAAITDFIPVYPFVKFLAWIPDVLILNPIQFWGFDVIDGKGAAFRHENPGTTKEPWFK